MWTGEPRANDEGGVQLSLESVQVNAIAVSHERRFIRHLHASHQSEVRLVVFPRHFAVDDTKTVPVTTGVVLKKSQCEGAQ
jgi:hypothetical protein